MGLYANLSINDHGIGTIEIIRITNTGTPMLDPDLVSSYEVRYYNNTSLHAKPVTPYHKTTLEHRYGDGALELLRKATNLLRAEGVDG